MLSKADLSLNKNEKKIALLSLTLMMIGAFFSTGFHQIDEHFQILEFAGFKLGLTPKSELPWEYHDRLRSAFQPYIVVFVFKLLSLVGLENPFRVATLLRMISGVLSWMGMCLFYFVGRKQLLTKNLVSWFLLFSFLSWFLFYSHVRFSSENWGGNFFVIGFSILFLSNKTYETPWFLSGLMMGLAFICRFQTALLILGLMSWLVFVRKPGFRAISVICVGLCLAVCLGVLLDYKFYDGWTLTPLNYFKSNIINDRISSFGHEPWWFYIKKSFEQLVPPFSLIFILGTLLYFFFNPKDALTWSLIPFLLVHFLITHKETRFLYPIVGFLPLIFIKFLSFLDQKQFCKKLIAKSYILKFYWLLNLVLLAFVITQPAKGNISLYKTIYSKYSKPVVLFFVNDDPYFEVWRFHFFSPLSLTTKPLSAFSETDLREDKVVLVAKRLTDELPHFSRPLSKIFSTYPDWLYPFHKRGWVSLRNTFIVYELK